MNPVSAALLALLAAIIALAAWRTARKMRRGGGCCGERETVALNGVRDRDKSHYPYRAELEIGGMTCENCARRVANALNALEGTWAVVRFGARRAEVRTKTPPDEQTLRRAVAAAGYSVAGYKAEP